jgi:hypothetical protein
LKLEGELSSGSTSSNLKLNPDTEEIVIKKIIKKVDFNALNLTNLDYSNLQKIYFNFKEMIDKSKELSKVNVILAMAEIALNQNYYGLQNHSNKAYSFWNNVKNQQFFGLYFSHFTAETLRKYWRELSSIKNIETLLPILNDKRNEIDSNDIK